MNSEYEIFLREKIYPLIQQIYIEISTWENQEERNIAMLTVATYFLYDVPKSIRQNFFDNYDGLKESMELF